MFAIALTAVAAAAPAAEPPKRPDPLPDRWLLKLAPKDLPKTPEAFWKTTWTRHFNPREGGGWTEWLAFAPDTDKANAEVTVTRQNFRFPGLDLKAPTVRTAPLAVHGPLVEFDGKLYTVAISEWKARDGRVTPLLNLGSAVEVKPNVWYQAFSDDLGEGKGKVTELLAEFAADPRTKNEGKVTVRKHLRMLTEAKGEATEFEGTFAKKERGSRPGVEITGFLKKSKAEPEAVRLWLQLAADEEPAAFNLARHERLAGASEPAPKAQPEPTPGLVQPPKKPEK